jgi:hypothetical protein
MKSSASVQRSNPAPFVAPHYEDGADETFAFVEPVEEPTDDFSADQDQSTQADQPQPRTPNPHIKTVSVQYGRKLNLGDYNSAEINVTLWADLDEDEDAQGALDLLYQQAKDNVKKQALPLLKAEPISLNYRETFLGTPVEPQAQMRKDK